jgi:hypothetical protein
MFSVVSHPFLELLAARAGGRGAIARYAMLRYRVLRLIFGKFPRSTATFDNRNPAGKDT